MLEDFQKHIDTNFPFLTSKKLLLAVSGGLDSMVMLHLFEQAGYEVVVAHCNFMLRGEESDGDTTFVKSYCDQRNLTSLITSFDTKTYAATKQVSIQVAARELRYDWFKELLEKHQCDYLLTAHHLNDDLETFLINFGRGTGLSGLSGIPAINKKTVRPLLKFSRKQIHQYAIENTISWREDTSNASDDYLRNHLRHKAIPELESVMPNLLTGFAKTQEHVRQSERLLKIYDEQLRQQFTYFMKSTSGSEGMVIDLEELYESPEPEAVLYRLLSAYGFTAWPDVYSLVSAQTGKQVFSKTHKLLKDRLTLQLFLLESEETNTYSWPVDVQEVIGSFGRLTMSDDKSLEVSGKNAIIVPTNTLQFPLTIRKWKHGDFFYPFGMKGKKKLSKYFKDEKLSLVSKENTWLLCSGPDIVWIIGHRADDRFKITDTETNEKTTTITQSYDL